MRLEKLGFPQHWFRAIITSGELAHARLGAMLDDGRLERGDGIAVLSRDDDSSPMQGHDLRRVAPQDSPKLLLIAGVEPETQTRESYRAAITPLARAGIAALCINPDTHIYSAGGRAFGPGLVAEDYEAEGGEVTLLGKPGAEMFDAGLTALGATNRARVLMIGDSPQHDIAGGNAAGCITLLIRGGVQSDAEAGPEPDYSMDMLRY